MDAILPGVVVEEAAATTQVKPLTRAEVLAKTTEAARKLEAGIEAARKLEAGSGTRPAASEVASTTMGTVEQHLGRDLAAEFGLASDTDQSQSGDSTFSRVTPPCPPAPVGPQRSNTKDTLAMTDRRSLSHASSTHSMPDDTVPRLATFKIKRPLGNSRPAEALFWPSGGPSGSSVTAPKLQEVFTKAWKLDPPNLIVYLEAGAAHPKDLATDQLVNSEQFKDWKSTALEQANLLRKRRPPPEQPDSATAVQHVEVPQAIAKEESELVNDIIDQMLFEKLVMVFCAILDAASLTNNWIVIDRSKGSSATAELLIEMALQQNSSSPTILVIEKKSRFEKFDGAEVSAQLQAIKRLADSSEIDFQQRKRVDLDALYDASEFSDVTEFRDQEYVNLPLPIAPMSEHITESGREVAVLGEKEKVKIGHKRLWMYHYTQFMFSAGTHYIFLQDDQTFPLEALGPIGAIFAHGGTAACSRMRSWLKQGKPTVMLSNSGGCTQAFASLHNAVVMRHLTNVKLILERMQLVSSERWASTFGIAEIMIMRELNSRAPVFTRKAVVSVDIIHDSAESVLQVVTNCFAAAGGDLPELGLGSAESDVVLRAWRQQEALQLNAALQRQRADVLFCLSMLLSFLIALLATIEPILLFGGGGSGVGRGKPTAPGTGSGGREGAAYTALLYVIIVLPLLSGIVATMTSRFRALQKWGVLRAAAFRSVTEIYKFRARALEYDIAPPIAVDAEAMNEADGARSQKRSTAYEARRHFVSAIQKIFSSVLDGDMNADALDFKARPAPGGVGQPGKDNSALDKHVLKHILHCSRFASSMKALKALNPRYQRKDEDANHPSNMEAGVSDLLNVELDDFLSPISIETYVEYRVKLLLAYYCEEGPKLTRRQSVLDSLSFVIIAAAAFYAILQMFNWVALTVALSSIIKNIDQHCSFASRLTALNAAVRDIQNMMVWWDSLTVIDRRTRATKTRALMIVESAALGVALAGTGMVASIASLSDEPADQADERRDGQMSAKKD